MRHLYIFLFLCCWQIKAIISQREVDAKERDRNEINDIFKRMRRAYESGDQNSIKPKTWGMILKNNNAKVWNELEAVPFIYNIDSIPYNEHESNPSINQITSGSENNDISVEMPNKFSSSSQKTPKQIDLFDEYETDPVDVPDSLLDVMKNEKFWTWLQSWTATYMELLLERIHESVVDEVDKQLKIRLINTTQTEDKPLTITYEESEDIDDDNNNVDIDDDDDDSYTYEDNEYPEDLDEEVQKPDDEQSDILEEIAIEEAYPQLDERIKEETEDVRPKRNNVEVKSGQIYGNSLNTNKVTNVFIFLQKPEDIFSVIRPLISNDEKISDEEDENDTEESNEVTDNELTDNEVTDNEVTDNEVTDNEATEEIVTEKKVTESEMKETETVTEQTIHNFTEDFTQTEAEPVQELPQNNE